MSKDALENWMTNRIWRRDLVEAFKSGYQQRYTEAFEIVIELSGDAPAGTKEWLEQTLQEINMRRTK